MMRTFPKIARILHTAIFVLIALGGLFTLVAVRADAEKHPGPPYYLLFEFLFVLLCVLFSLSAILLWVWKPGGWWLTVFLDGAIALFAAYIAISDFLCNPQVPFALDATSLGISLFFGVIFTLLASRPSRTFFRIAAPINS